MCTYFSKTPQYQASTGLIKKPLVLNILPIFSNAKEGWQ